MRVPWPLVIGLALLAACQTRAPEPIASVREPVAEAPLEGWRAVALPEDRRHLERIADAWEQALAEARRRGFGAHLRDEGALLDPDAALPRATLAPGPYRCRLIRFGAGRRAVTAYRRYFCHVAVEGELMSLTKDDGSERPGGYLWPDGDERQIFLGAVALGGEPMPPAYRDDETRNLVGIVERVEPFRYRLVMPWPPSGATLDVLELIPFVLDDAE